MSLGMETTASVRRRTYSWSVDRQNGEVEAGGLGRRKRMEGEERTYTRHPV